MIDSSMNKLVNIIKDIANPSNRPDTMIFGTVTSLEPINIDIGNNVVLTEDFIFLGQNVRPHKVTIPHTHIVESQMTMESPSLGNIGAGLIQGTTYESTQKALAESTIVTYTTLDENGDEVESQIKESDLGRGAISTSIIVGGQATVVDDSVMITDNKHKHIIPRQKTLDVHYPKSDYADYVTIEIYPKLKVGDKVLMFAFNNYQLYYVAERIEGD